MKDHSPYRVQWTPDQQEHQRQSRFDVRRFIACATVILLATNMVMYQALMTVGDVPVARVPKPVTVCVDVPWSSVQYTATTERSGDSSMLSAWTPRNVTKMKTFCREEYTK